MCLKCLKNSFVSFKWLLEAFIYSFFVLFPSTTHTLTTKVKFENKWMFVQEIMARLWKLIILGKRHIFWKAPKLLHFAFSLFVLFLFFGKFTKNCRMGSKNKYSSLHSESENDFRIVLSENLYSTAQVQLLFQHPISPSIAQTVSHPIQFRFPFSSQPNCVDKFRNVTLFPHE